MKRLLLGCMGSIVVFLVLLYAGDYLWIRFPIPRSRQQFGSVTVTPIYIIHEKNGKTEYDFRPPEDDPCVQSLFPHFGYPPCWYLRRHAEKHIDI